ncbi:Hypothetical predicted protein [Mytilus galloprovincialis]|uniref:Uncharacterized protein n=1 Tax=Mytilus galloprovincialis TaxID=29158 RepID=A0A8B6HMT8_MYTGA|nr:Hypothetical predicted protein [Mytilus galloprovincialis]
MGIIVLNILADASYDLLKQDKPNLRPRSDCDITYLFDDHNKPAILYTDQLNKILAKTVSAEEVKLIKNEIFEMTIEVDFEHQVNLPAQ